MQMPVDSYAADMSSQAAVAFRAGSAREGVEPVDGLKVPYRVAEGASQSGLASVAWNLSVVATYNKPASVRREPHAGIQQPRPELTSRVQHFAGPPQAHRQSLEPRPTPNQGTSPRKRLGTSRTLDITQNDTFQVRMCGLHGYSPVDWQHDSCNVSGLL